MAVVKLLEFREIDEEFFTRWDITGHQLNRHLMSESLTGTPDVLADFVTLPPGFIHHMHRHPNADQFMVPLTGSLQFNDADGLAMALCPGRLLVVPRGNWHELSNLGTEHSQVLHFFTGVGSIEDVGIEPYPSDGALGRGTRSQSSKPRGRSHCGSRSSV